MNPAQELSTPTEGPASLREALAESFDEQAGTKPAAPASTDDEPTGDEPNPAASADDEANEPQGDEPSDGEGVIQAPEHWSDEDRTMFGALSGDAQEYLLRREKQYEQGIQEKSEKLAEFDKIFEPYEPFLRMRGIDRPTALRTWVAAQQALDANPVAAIRHMASGYGDDVEKALFGAPEKTGAGDGLYDDDLDVANQNLNQHKNDLSEENQRLALQRQQWAATEIQKFRDEKDSDGNLLRPHFDAAIQTMRGFLATGQAVNLEDAYEKAIWTVPEYREQHQESLLEARKKEEAAKREEAALKAKKTAKSVEGSGSKPPPPKKQPTLRDDLGQAWDDSVTGEL